MKLHKRLLLAAMLLFVAGGARAQGFIYSQPVLNGSGRPVAGANAAVCTTLATTAAAVLNNVASLTMASNPITAGFTQGSTLIVSQFTGGDTYFNGTFTIAAVSATTISYGLTHANASAGTNGVAVQIGTSTTACAPLATIYTDQTDTVISPNPFFTDGLGNLTFTAVPGNYVVQIYGPTVNVTKFTATVPCVPTSACPINGSSITNNSITAIQLATQYSKLRCDSGLGDGLNAVAAGTYLQTNCFNDSGVTWTIARIGCFTDNAGTSSLAATNGAATALLTGPVTCNASAGGNAGTQSATVTIANGDVIKFTWIADGTSKQTEWFVSLTQ